MGIIGVRSRRSRRFRAIIGQIMQKGAGVGDRAGGGVRVVKISTGGRNSLGLLVPSIRTITQQRPKNCGK